MSNEIKPLQAQLDALKREKERLANDVKIQATRTRELKSRLKATEEQKSTLERETKDLTRKKSKLSPEVEKKKNRCES